MGVSTNAILFFGFNLSEDNVDLKDLFGWEHDDWQDEYVHRRGWRDTSGMFTPQGDHAHKKGSKSNLEAEARWKKQHEDMYQLLNDIKGLIINVHCSDDCSIPYFSMHQYVSYRGDCNNVIYPILLSTIQADMELISSGRKFCEFLNIPWQEPKWNLVSYWG